MSFRRLLVQMLAIISHQCPAILKWQRCLQHMMQLSSPCWRLEAVPLEKSTLWFFSPSSVRGDGCHAVTLTNYHPEMGLPLTVLWKNKIRSARDSRGLQITRMIKLILKKKMLCSVQLWRFYVTSAKMYSFSRLPIGTQAAKPHQDLCYVILPSYIIKGPVFSCPGLHQLKWDRRYT